MTGHKIAQRHRVCPHTNPGTAFWGISVGGIPASSLAKHQDGVMAVSRSVSSVEQVDIQQQSMAQSLIFLYWSADLP